MARAYEDEDEVFCDVGTECEALYPGDGLWYDCVVDEVLDDDWYLVYFYDLDEQCEVYADDINVFDDDTLQQVLAEREGTKALERDTRNKGRLAEQAEYDADDYDDDDELDEEDELGFEDQLAAKTKQRPTRGKPPPPKLAGRIGQGKKAPPPPPKKKPLSALGAAGRRESISFQVKPSKKQRGAKAATPPRQVGKAARSGSKKRGGSARRTTSKRGRGGKGKGKGKAAAPVTAADIGDYSSRNNGEVDTSLRPVINRDSLRLAQPRKGRTQFAWAKPGVKCELVHPDTGLWETGKVVECYEQGMFLVRFDKSGAEEVLGSNCLRQKGRR